MSAHHKVAEAAAAASEHVWPNVSKMTLYEIWGIPALTFILFVILFNLWPAPSMEEQRRLRAERKAKAKAESRKAGTTTLLEAGEVGGSYEDVDWTESYDMRFLIFMIFVLASLVIATTVSAPELWSNETFWLHQLPKPCVMIFINICMGYLVRSQCETNEMGYIMTVASSKFKVNYTRKVQHFMAYLIPLVIKTPADCHCDGIVEFGWGQWLTLVTFLGMIKPVREAMPFFMLQFNALDRPEDRPNTLEWITVGNIIPGSLFILFFKSIFPEQNQGLVLIFVFVTGLGDGLAEPVGITFGRHKYKVSGFEMPIWYTKEDGWIWRGRCTSEKQYERSYEGSACVFLSGMIFTSMCYASFDNATQFWVCFALQGPLMSVAEAISPHTMDTPFLMGLGGGSIYAIINYF
jgi:dolichol kinase